MRTAIRLVAALATLLYVLARLCRDLVALMRGPSATAKRFLIRKPIGRLIGRSGITRWPR